MSQNLSQNRQACIAQLKAAFAECPRPELDQLAPHGGIDGPYVIENWAHLDRESVLELSFFDSSLAEDLSYMSSIALRYFLPSVLILFLQHPARIDFGGFISLISRLEGMFGCRDKGEAYRQVQLTLAQRHAIRDWCGQIQTIIRKFDLSSCEGEYANRLKRLRKAILMNGENEDHEAGYAVSHAARPKDC